MYLRNYQTVDDTLPSRFGPYKQLPRIYYTGRGPSVGNSLENGNIGLNLLGHYVNYEKDDSLTVM